jgi:hypothetical protein
LESDESKYEYAWYTYPILSTGYSPKRDTIGTSKNLSYIMAYAPDNYQLIFEVKEKRRGIASIKRVRLEVSTTIASGWYIVNDINNTTDVDFINRNGIVMDDIFSMANSGEKLQGQGVKIVYQNGYYNHDKVWPDGTVQRLSSQKVFHILSNQDFKTVAAGTFEKYKNFEDAFYSAPTVKRPQDFVAAYFGDMTFMNDGKLYMIYGATAGPGKFGVGIGDGSLYSCLLSGDVMSDVNVFSQATGNFYTGNTAVPQLDKVSNPDALGWNYNVIWMGARYAMFASPAAWAILQSKTNPNSYSLANIRNSYGTLSISFHPLNSSLKLLSANIYGVHATHTAAFYYGKANVLSYYQIGDASGDYETDLYTFPAGEVISCILTNNTTKNLEVLTNKDNKWKLYIFKLATNGTQAYLDSSVTQPITTYSGNGNARHVAYY